MSVLSEKIRGGAEFAVSCEYVPGRGSRGPAVEEVIECGRKILAAGLPVHALSITDNPGGNPAISPDVLAAELRAMGIDSLVHFSCASLNRNLMESRATSLARQGLENLLVLTGDYPVGGFEGQARPVFDLDSVQALRYLKAMNRGIELPARKKDAPPDRLPGTNFFLGCAVSPFKFTEGELVTQYAKLEKKIASGADFVITQLGYDIRKFAEVLKYLRLRGLNVPVIGNCYVLSRPVAKLMHAGELPGCVVSDGLMQALETEAQAADKGRQARLDRAAKLTALFRGLSFAGVHIGGFGLKFDDIKYIITKSEEWSSRWREFIPDFQFGRKNEFYLFPEDRDLSFAPEKLRPLPLKKKRVVSPHFRLARLSHRLVFTEGAPGYRLGRVFYRAVEKSKALKSVAYLGERIVKEALFDCQECGDCALFDTAYLCPMSQCAKSQRNGPCGGSRDGMCEADAEKKCIWVRAYDRLSAMGRLDWFRGAYAPPPNCALAGTSGWANFLLGRDHAAHAAPATAVPRH